MTEPKTEIPADCHTGPHRVELDSWIGCAPFERLLNMKIEQAQNGKAVLRMPFCRQYAQGAGLMHGGALVSLADTAVVMAIKSLLEPDSHFATISMESRFLYPVKSGTVTAKAQVTRREGRTLEGEATVYNEEERAVFSFSSVFRIARDTKIRQPG